MSDYGPNVTKLILQFVAREAVPPGGGFAAGLEFFINQEHRKRILATAEADAIEVLRAIKAAPDNPFGDDDEVIAEELLRRIEKRKMDKILAERMAKR